MPAPFSGGCSWGAIRYTCTAEPYRMFVTVPLAKSERRAHLVSRFRCRRMELPLIRARPRRGFELPTAATNEFSISVETVARRCSALVKQCLTSQLSMSVR